MKATFIDIQLRGVGFVPSKLASLTDFAIESVVEAGNIAKVGRYKGKPSPYGLGIIKIISDLNAIETYINLLYKQRDVLAECMVDEVVFDVEASVKGINGFKIDQRVSKMLEELGARIEIHTGMSNVA